MKLKKDDVSFSNFLIQQFYQITGTGKSEKILTLPFFLNGFKTESNC